MEKKLDYQLIFKPPPQFAFSEIEKKLEMTDKSIKLSEYIFNESVDRLASFFPRSKIKIIYIPSTVSSYNIVSSHIHFRGLMQHIHVGETALGRKNSYKFMQNY